VERLLAFTNGRHHGGRGELISVYLILTFCFLDDFDQTTDAQDLQQVVDEGLQAFCLALLVG